MFFKRQKVRRFPKGGPLTEIAWDDRTVKWIAESEQLNVYVTHIWKTVSLGTSSHRYSNRSDWTGHGVMTYPKFIPVNIWFDAAEEKQFGGFLYDRRDNTDFGGQKVNLPTLEIWLSDRDEQKAQLLYTALRDAIISGRKCIGVRFWKKKGEGVMTQMDKEHGFSYESRYDISGMVAWTMLHAVRLPKWAVPTDYRDFSVDALPKSQGDLDAQLDR
jgi:hypothetical protein